MKNIEYMIQLLTDEVHDPFDSGGADWEAMAHSRILYGNSSIVCLEDESAGEYADQPTLQPAT